MRIINTFSPAYAEAILTQKKEGTICAVCGFTEIEHSFEPDKCCHKRGAGAELSEKGKPQI